MSGVADSIWTAEAIQELERLMGLEENLTFVEIAEKLTAMTGKHFGRNACIGKAHRLRLPPRPSHLFKKKTERSLKIVPVDAPIAPRIHRRQTDGLSIYQLERDDCRWPTGDKPPLRYCGRPTLEGGSYCEAHSIVAYNKPRKDWA